jgi:ribosome-associated toxin RatA of RatAB toxin-antitoxin module
MTSPVTGRSEDVSSNVVRQTIVVAADPAAVMKIIADLEAYPQWQPDIKDVEILETGDDGRARRARFEVSAVGFTASFELEYEYTSTEMRWRLVESDVLTRSDGSYVLVDQGDGTTQVTYELDVDTSIAVPAFLRRQIANRVVSSALQGVKRRAEV